MQCTGSNGLEKVCCGRRGNCAIVVTGGGYALHPAAGRSSLILSKAALRSLVMSLAQELGLIPHS